jgi:hypothetical protein
MKFLLLSLALCAGLAGCAPYPVYDYPVYTVAPSYDPNTGMPYYPPYVYPSAPYGYAYPYAYPYPYPYYGYGYAPLWFSGAWYWGSGGGHYHGGGGGHGGHGGYGGGGHGHGGGGGGGHGGGGGGRR